MERGNGKSESPECSFCLATASYEGSLNAHPHRASVSGVETGAPRAGQTPPHNDVNECHTVITMMMMMMGHLASHVNRGEASMYKHS